MTNKDRFFAWAKVAAIIVWSLIAIATSSAVWNAAAGSRPDTFIQVVAALNLVVNGFGIYLAIKKYKPLND